MTQNRLSWILVTKYGDYLGIGYVSKISNYSSITAKNCQKQFFSVCKSNNLRFCKPVQTPWFCNTPTRAIANRNDLMFSRLASSTMILQWHLLLQLLFNLGIHLWFWKTKTCTLLNALDGGANVWKSSRCWCYVYVENIKLW